MITSFLYPQDLTRHPEDWGWPLERIPSPVDAVAFDYSKLGPIADIVEELRGTITLTIPIWIERGGNGVQMSAMVTPKVASLTPYELPPRRQEDGGFYLDHCIAGLLQSGDQVQVIAWSRGRRCYDVTTRINLMTGPEVGFPNALWENPDLFRDLVSDGYDGPVRVYFPPLPVKQQRRLHRALYGSTPRLSKDARWVRWAPSPFLVMESIIPRGAEALLEQNGWSVGVMARIAYDLPTPVWIARDLDHTPFEGPATAWIHRGDVRIADSVAETLPLDFPFAIHALQPIPITQPVARHRGNWERPWPGIVLHCPLTYETFQDWMARTLADGLIRSVFPTDWGQPDPQPVITGLESGNRLVVAFHEWQDLDHLQRLGSNINEQIQGINGAVLSMEGWLRRCAQWL